MSVGSCALRTPGLQGRVLVSQACRPWRFALLAVLGLLVAACGQVGVSGPSALSSSNPTGVAGQGGGSTSSGTDTPLISGTPTTSAIVGQSYSFTPTASDPQGNALTYSISNLPPWANFDSASGTLSGTPTAASIGTFGNIQISVTNGQAMASLAAFSITVEARLTISGSPATTGVVGSAYDFVPSTNAPPGTSLTFAVQNAPSWATFNTATGELSGTPTQTGSFPNIMISVSDGIQSSALAAFTISVSPQSSSGSPPTISGQPPAGVIAGTPYSFTPTAASSSGKPLTFSVQNAPSWTNFSSATGTLAGTPTTVQVGTYANIVISVSDGTLSASLPAFSIKVVAPLTISGTPPTQVIAGQNYSFKPTVSAPSGAELTFTIQNRPAWATFSAVTGTLSGTPTPAEAGIYGNILIGVSDGVQTLTLPAFAIQVVAPLTISGTPPAQVAAGKSYAFQPSTNAPSGTQLTFAIQNQPAWTSFNTATGALSGTPSISQVGTYANIAISVSNGTQSAVLPAFSITVTQTSSGGLTISGSAPNSAKVGALYSFTPTTTDPGGNPLTFSIQNPPSWLRFNTATGALTGTPGTANVGTFLGIVITVSDGSASASLPPFSITVTNTDSGPTISGNPSSSATVGSTYSFTPTSTDPSGSKLTFSIQNQPSWASFDTTSGALRGTPAAGNVGTTAGIVISVSDGTLSASLAPFSITVTASSAPTISGSPPTSVNVGSAYSFTPATTDPSGNKLTFSIQNLPSWASFNSATGALTGTPAAANAGTYANIVISVSDGTASASLPPFSITVNQASNGTATLNWTAVTTTTSGGILTNLAGYMVYYGTSPSAMNTVVTLANPSVTTYLVQNLTSGTWYFAVAAYTTSGTVGVQSNVGQKTIP